MEYWSVIESESSVVIYLTYIVTKNCLGRRSHTAEDNTTKSRMIHLTQTCLINYLTSIYVRKNAIVRGFGNARWAAHKNQQKLKF